MPINPLSGTVSTNPPVDEDAPLNPTFVNSNTNVGPGVIHPSFENGVQGTSESLSFREPQGTVLLTDGTRTSYSGADIKVVVHVYDGGRLTDQRIADIQSQMEKLIQKSDTLEAQLAELQSVLDDPDAILAPSTLSRFNGINRELNITRNTINALFDEMTRLSRSSPNFSTKVLAELQTLTVSVHREKWPVRSLGAGYVRSYVRGQRTIAGSMIFTVFDRDVLSEFLESHPSDFDAHNPTSTAILDQLPPFDITVAFANELGQVSRMAVYGVEFVNQSQSMSIEDLFIENTVQYIARDFDPMRVVSGRSLDENNRMTKELIPQRGSDLLSDPDYQEFKENMSPFSRFRRRANPFI